MKLTKYCRDNLTKVKRLINNADESLDSCISIHLAVHKLIKGSRRSNLKFSTDLYFIHHDYLRLVYSKRYRSAIKLMDDFINQYIDY